MLKTAKKLGETAVLSTQVIVFKKLGETAERASNLQFFKKFGETAVLSMQLKAFFCFLLVMLSRSFMFVRLFLQCIF